jgi:membrane fusion protein, multidrug efflux system
MSEPDHPSALPSARRRGGTLWRLGLAAAVFVAIAAYGILDRNRSDAELSQWTKEQAVPNVDLVTAKHPTEVQHLSLPADVEAFYTAPIHARVNGYVKMWYFDIGAKVKAGTVLAKIDTPELDQQFEQAKGELAKAQADLNLARLTADRWRELRASQAVSQQTADEKAGDALAKKAQVDAAQANVDRIKALLQFKDITAPFDGVVTARRIDVGALVSSTNSSAPGLFDVAAVDKMRAYVRVPQVYVSRLAKGMKVSLRLPQLPGQTFESVLTTTSDAISRESRAQLVELMIDNHKGVLPPGAYAEATFALPLDAEKLAIPASALIFRDMGAAVAVVGSDSRVTLKPVTVALDTGSIIELSSGIGPNDRIIQSPSDSIATGDVVRIMSVDGQPQRQTVVARDAAE